MNIYIYICMSIMPYIRMYCTGKKWLGKIIAGILRPRHKMVSGAMPGSTEFH